MNLLCCCCCTMAPNTRVTRKWELFAGRNKFYCDGLLMSAPHTGVFYLTCFLITGTSALFFAFDCPYLATRITPAIPIIGAVLYFFTMSSLLRTTFTDPGVIPRASLDEAAYIEKQIEVPNSLNSPTYRPPPRTKEVLVKGQTVKLKYCFTCKIFRPPRASHCSLCDNCVDRFDHHCPWVGNCVGKRNYRFFYMFLVSLAFLAVFIFSCSVTHLVLLMKMEQEVFEVIKKAPFSVIVTFICFFSIWSVIGLAGFHTYLTTSDQTTNEDLKGSFTSKGGQRAVNPYSRGNICLNCVHILCGPMQPSLIDRRGIVTDEYILQMQHNISQNPNNQLLTEVTATPSALITNQPSMGMLDPPPAKHRTTTFDETHPGIYRHRSYDNLQNGNSNSLARLVDNEIPLSNRDGPSGVVMNNINDNFHNCQQISPTTTDDDNIDDNSLVIMSRKHNFNNNLSGSYNNLFRDNVDNILCYDNINNDDNNNDNNDDKDNLSVNVHDGNADDAGIGNSFKMHEIVLSSSSPSDSPLSVSSSMQTSPVKQQQQQNTMINVKTSKSLPMKSGLGTTSVMAAVAMHSISLCNSMKNHDYSNFNETSTCSGGINKRPDIETDISILTANNLRISNSDTENVYSNIPNSTNVLLSSAVSSNGSNKSDMHVYSNIIEEHERQQQQQQQHQQQQLQKPKQYNSSQNIDEIQTPNISNKQAFSATNNKETKLSSSKKISETTSEKNLLEFEPISTTLLSNDLDLDDPVSAFVLNSNLKHFDTSTNMATNKKKQYCKNLNQQHDYSETLPNAVDLKALSPSTSSSSSIGTTKITTTAEISTPPNHHHENLPSSTDKNLTTPKSTKENKDAVGFITPSHLRHLQDTTMINTALDLDSLDGSSIGNNSQSCLVTKTAIV